MKRVVSMLMVVVLFGSCVTQTLVTFESNEEGATVYLDNQPVGETPFSRELSNALWDTPSVKVEKDGYRRIVTDLDREIKPANLIFGLILWFPSLFWVWGPDEYQYYDLIEK